MPPLQHIPKFPLTQFIDCLWYELGHTPYTREKVLPSGTLNLMINLGSPHKVFDKSNAEKFHLHKESWVSGFQTEYIVIEATAETNVMGVRFKPGGAYPFFGFPISELTGYIIDMEQIWGGLVHEIRERLLEAKKPSKKFNLLEKVLLNQLNTNGEDFRAVRFAVNEILFSRGISSIRELSHQLGMSQKHLIYQFHKFVGVPPKLLSRIAKFNNTLNTIDPSNPIDWASIAYECGYSDQAHFNKDFRAFSGLTPTTYMDLRAQFFPENPQQGEDVNFVPIG